MKKKSFVEVYTYTHTYIVHNDSRANFCAAVIVMGMSGQGMPIRIGIGIVMQHLPAPMARGLLDTGRYGDGYWIANGCK